MSLPISDGNDSFIERYRRGVAEVSSGWQRSYEEAQENYRREREQLVRSRDRYRQNASEAVRIIVQLRRDLVEKDACIDQSDRDNRNLRDQLQRIELLIGNFLPSAEIAFRSSLIKYTSPAYWVFSVYDMVYGMCSALKTHLYGLKRLAFG